MPAPLRLGPVVTRQVSLSLLHRSSVAMGWPFEH
jgi:hypothetical protein